ncbi:MAG TPA: leucine-rich repeat protein, partial [Tissierellaceae bacterium]|nr:leucine-rich repeat protein [Tissierellaceae bacterium]
KGLETISYNAFIGCSSLTEIEIPKNLKNVHKYIGRTGPFGNCESLKKVSFEEGTVNIAVNIFNGSEYIQEVTIPDTVLEIGDGAFYGCTGIRSMKLPESVDKIGNQAFYDCSSLESINLPNKITYIGESAFRGCSKLSDLVLPKGLETIGYDAFVDCSSLTEIEIPKNLKKVYKYGLNTGPFGNCENLRKVTFEEGTVNITDSIFYKTEYIQEVTIPDTVLEIGNNAFYGCKRLESITLPESLQKIGESAFSYCNRLENIYIPASVTSIYDNAFSNCSNLKWAKFAGNAPEYFGRNTSNSNIFSNCDSNFKVYYYKHNTGFTNPWYGYATEAIDAIKTQPVSKTVTEGDSVTLTIDAVSNDNGILTYQWKKDGVDIKGATSKNHKIEYVKATDAGDYTVVVTNTNGIDSLVSITSKIAKITVSQKFSDIPLDHWAHEYIMNLSSEDVINGYRDGSFGAGDNITRAQAAVMIVNALDIEYKGKVPAFKDVAKDYWAAEQIAAANEAGILNGNKAGEFKPGDYITRAQIAVMISNAYKFKQAGGYKNFKDVPVGSNGHWAYEKIEILASNGIISGYRDGNFGPGDNTTRAQFSVILSKAMDTTEK